jgi:hypothetical protein
MLTLPLDGREANNSRESKRRSKAANRLAAVSHDA